MKNTIKCNKCGNEIEIDVVLEEKFRHKIEGEAINKAYDKAKMETELEMKKLRDDSEEQKLGNKKLREQMSELLEEIRLVKREKDEVELKAKKQIMEEEEKIKLTEQKKAEESNRLKFMEMQSQLQGALKANEDLRRKLEQGSQQLQGEVQEMDLKQTLIAEFPDDDIGDVEKGIRGADLKQVVQTKRGTKCGVILWESKRTKAWVDEWTTKLKEDMRLEGANVAIIVTNVLPKEFKGDLEMKDGVYVTIPKLATALAGLVREGLIGVARQKHFAQNRGEKADLIYDYLTGHEFVQQVQAIGEAYRELVEQIDRERAAYERIWKAREGQAQRIRLSLSSIYGQVQGLAGLAALPSLPILELDQGE